MKKFFSNKEQNIKIAESVVRVALSTVPHIFIIFSDLSKSNTTSSSFSFSLSLYINIYHHVSLSARISLTHSSHPSASDRSSGIHLVSAQCYCMYVRDGRPVFARPREGVNRSTSPMSSSLPLQQCPACMVCLILIGFMMGGCTAAALWGAVSRTCSILLAAFLCSCCQAFIFTYV